MGVMRAPSCDLGRFLQSQQQICCALGTWWYFLQVPVHDGGGSGEGRIGGTSFLHKVLQYDQHNVVISSRYLSIVTCPGTLHHGQHSRQCIAPLMCNPL